ncbi:MAG: MarR family winged helix-turn-helix transcriptional regulator [Solirubrobacteraceae bacterium]
MPKLAEHDLATWRAFLTAHARITRRINRDLLAAGLPDLSWYDALWALHEAPGRRLRVSELADAVVLSPTGMSRFADRLERDGLVRREAVPGDRRALHVVLTGDGLALLRRMWPVYSAGIAAYFAPAVGGAAGEALHALAHGLPSPA